MNQAKATKRTIRTPDSILCISQSRNIKDQKGLPQIMEEEVFSNGRGNWFTKMNNTAHDTTKIAL